MRLASIATVLLLALAAPTIAQENRPDILKGANDAKWGPAPPVLPKGVQIAVLSGDPTKSGPFVVRLKLPANTKVPAHHHPTVENITVISGKFHLGMGDKLDEKNATAFEPGGFESMPANMNHYAWADAESVIQLHGQGPFKIEYVNPADDSRKTKRLDATTLISN
jgi:quercetin dioxygenase-like cupin family protein